MPDNARSEILQRIRTANHAGTGMQAAEQSWRLVPRGFHRTPSLRREQILELFVDRLRDYDAAVVRVGANELSLAIARIVSTCHLERILLASGFPLHWVLPGAHWTHDAQFSSAELDQFDCVLTGATLGIAETGTLVLQNVEGQGRRAATLIPDVHICVLQAEKVVETVPEAIDRLAQTAHLPTTFVSGPSATADIEMTRIKGVHGPRFLHVLLID